MTRGKFRLLQAADLGHLVLEAPTERGRDWVCKRILSCPDEHALALLAQKYIFTFIGACASSASHLAARSQLFIFFYYYLFALQIKR